MLSVIDAINLQSEIIAFRAMKADLENKVLELGLVLDRIQYFCISAYDTTFDTDDLPL